MTEMTDDQMEAIRDSTISVHAALVDADDALTPLVLAIGDVLSSWSEDPVALEKWITYAQGFIREHAESRFTTHNKAH